MAENAEVARDERAETHDFTAEHRGKLTIDGIVGTSNSLGETLRQVAVAAAVPTSVLITGESGTGKTAIARAIHESSTRSAGPFVELNCTTIPETLFESELFGAEKGAHSTALRRIEGKIDAAGGGTLLLDEVGDLPLAVQGKLLRFLQSRRYYRLGSTTPIEADVRILAATNANLPERVAEKRFREDLFYRLSALEVHVPPLRERRADIEVIAEAIAGAIGRQHGRTIESTRTIEPEHVFPSSSLGRAENEPEPILYDDAFRRFQADFLARALDRYGWNVSETARRVGLARSHVNELIRVYGLTRRPKK
jgi:Nif-specific regulatory protein